jgi:protease-4
MSNRFIFGRVIGTAWTLIDGFRKLLHLFLLLGLFLIVVAALSRPGPRVPGAAALLIAPQGVLVDQLSGDPLDQALARAQGSALQETLLKDLLDAIRAAKDDERIKALVLQTDGMSGAGLSKLQELAEELAAFKESGKPVFAVGDGFTRDQYHLAAQADEILMHPMGFVLVDGYSRFQPYFKSAIDKLFIDFNVWTVGEYKSVVEPITRDDMSEEDREATVAYLDGLWSSYQADVAAARELPADAMQRYADGLADLLRGASGNTAQLALDFGLVDALVHRDGVREKIREAVGSSEDDETGFPAISHDAYLRAARVRAPASGDSRVGVVVLSGEIVDGSQPSGTIGGDSAARLIREAADDDDVKALVLRVDSPGGSAFASEVILREIEVFQQSGRPVVVSMGSVAASGGYWISMSADEIWASPSTLTGSIGVAGMLPTFQRTLGQLGVNIDGVGTTTLAGQSDVLQGLGEDIREILGQTVVETYEQFIGRVASHRGRSVDEIDSVARGRVWTGAAALERGLIDALGDLDDAIASAAELAGLEEGRYDVHYIQPPLGFAERLALGMVHVGAPAIRTVDFSPVPREVEMLIESAREPLRALQTLNDPRHTYAHCFCDVQ